MKYITIFLQSHAIALHMVNVKKKTKNLWYLYLTICKNLKILKSFIFTNLQIELE